MKIDEWTSEDVRNQGGGESPTCAGLASNALPEAQSIISAESSQTGVSTRNARSETMFQPQNKGKFHIGMSYVVHTAERRKLTTTW